jgi:hypothetical protein
MKSKSRLTLAALATVSLVLAACGGDDSSSSDSPSTEAPAATDAPSETEAPEATEAPAEERTASDVGVTADTITIAAAVSDLEAVRALGISIPDTLTTEHLFDRWKMFTDDINDAGGINGRTINLIPVTWNPVDQSSFDTLCAEATIDNEIFMVVNGTGLSSIARECLLDSGMVIMYGDVMSAEEMATGLTVSLAPPSADLAVAAVNAWVASTDAAPGSTVGVLSNNSPALAAAGKAAEAAITEAGFTPVLVEINSQSGDNAAINQEGADAVGVFEAEGVVQVFVGIPFTEFTGFSTAAAAASLPYSIMDTSSSGCSPYGATQVKPEAYGSECVTYSDHATDGTSIRPDTEFEAQCRATFDENFESYYGGKSMPGVPAGRIVEDASGKVFISDHVYMECSLMNIMKLALEAAGVNPTRASFVEAALGLGEVPLANIGGGTGILEPGKPYAANAVHTVRMVGADATTAPDANGLYNGCSYPGACAIVVSDWSPIR